MGSHRARRCAVPCYGAFLRMGGGTLLFFSANKPGVSPSDSGTARSAAGGGRGSCIRFPVEWDNDFLLAHEPELSAGNLFDVRRVGSQFFHLLTKLLVFFAKLFVLGEELLLLPVQIESAYDAHFPEAGLQEGQKGHSSDDQERPTVLEPRFPLVILHVVTRKEWSWTIRKPIGARTPPSRFPGRAHPRRTPTTEYGPVIPSLPPRRRSHASDRRPRSVLS